LAGALSTAREIGTIHHAIELDARDLAATIDTVAWHLDEPIGDPAAFAVYRVCQLAREHVKVVLGGEGADELFAGYAARYQGILNTLERSDRLRRWLGWLPVVASGARSTRWNRLRRRARLSRGAELLSLRTEGFPGDIRQPRGLSGDQLGRLDGRCEALARELHRPHRDELTEVTALDVRWQLAESLLQKADKMSMAASIEMRSPLLDVEVARLAGRMHSSLKLSRDGSLGKLVLRKSLARQIAEPAARPKLGFPVPLDVWLRGPLRPHVEQHVLWAGSAAANWLDPSLVQAAWRDFLAGCPGLARAFYSLWLYDVWYHRMLRSAPARPPRGTAAIETTPSAVGSLG
jgi:asparagine synthase (glutamine-hydrolysing)